MILYAIFLALSFASTAPVRIQQYLSEWKATSGLASYPTDFTGGIIPVRIHSHNDYWRDVPLFSALSVGAISVESDVFLYNSTLYVGHDVSSLSHNRTFQSLYVQPLLNVLHKQNPRSDFVSGITRNGVFDASPQQTLYLWVDLKTSGEDTWAAVVEELEPLRRAKYLTAYTGGVVVPGPITVIGTGNTPESFFHTEKDRDTFFDAPLLSLAKSNITSHISPFTSDQISVALGEVTQGVGMNETQIETVREHVELAGKRGMQVRYWDLPPWSIKTRNSVWRQLVDAGVGLLNVDDLEAAAGLGGVGAEW